MREFLLREALIFTLVFCRIGGFVVTSPFPGDKIPRSSRLALTLALAFFCRTVMNVPPRAFALDYSVLAPVVSELAIGAMIGFSFRVLLSACDVAGELLGQATGLGSASLMNPLFGDHETVLSRVMSMAGLLLVLTSGTHRVVLAYLIDSFSGLPLGTSVNVQGATLPILDAFVESMAVGLRLAMPVVAMSVLVQVALALVARMAPSLQIFNIGFAILIGAGLLTLAAGLRDMSSWILAHLGKTPAVIERVLSGATG